MTNQLNIQSTGLTVLQNIINRFVNDNEVEVRYTMTAQPFFQKFKDVTAGVFIRVDFVVPNIGLCDYD